MKKNAFAIGLVLTCLLSSCALPGNLNGFFDSGAFSSNFAYSSESNPTSSGAFSSSAAYSSERNTTSIESYDATIEEQEMWEKIKDLTSKSLGMYFSCNNYDKKLGKTVYSHAGKFYQKGDGTFLESLQVEGQDDHREDWTFSLEESPSYPGRYIYRAYDNVKMTLQILDNQALDNISSETRSLQETLPSTPPAGFRERDNILQAHIKEYDVKMDVNYAECLINNLTESREDETNVFSNYFEFQYGEIEYLPPDENPYTLI